MSKSGNKSIAIANPDFDLNQNRIEIKKEFDRLVKEGIIVFTTFHQSMSYEDFIEGIKPIVPKIEGHPVIYKVIPGILKEICEQIKYIEKLTANSLLNANSVSNFDELYSAFINKLKEIISELEENESHAFQSRRSSVKLIKIENDDSILTSGETASSTDKITKDKLERIYNRFSSPDEITNIVKQLREVGTDIGWTTNYFAVFKALKQFEASIKTNTINNFETKKKQNFVLIIDEINRGNVSQIFGELITLIEDDKRMGEKEALEVTLPYSKEKYSVPSNLYIIGTMNTADRSVEALDSALRRRFSFEETPPLPEILSPGYRYWDLLWEYKNYEWENEEFVSKEKQMLDFFGASQNIWDTRKDLWEEFKKENKDEKQVVKFINADFTGVNLQDILLTINKRIEKLLDKDHKIGHSYFINVSSMNELKTAFHNKIIPLLQEYFFGDYTKIGLVLGKGFIEKESDENSLFAEFDNDYDFDYSEKQIFYLKDISKMNDGEFKEAIRLLLNK